MSLNEEEIQQLELLAILRENGKLTEDQFQLQTSAILRSSAVRRAPAHPLIQRIFGRPQGNRKAIEVEKKSLVPVPKKELILERHLIPDKVEKEQDPVPSVMHNQEEIDRYAARKRKPSLSTLVSMRTEEKQKKTSLFATLATVTIAIVFTSFIANSAPLELVIEKIDTRKEPSAIAMQQVSKEIKPGFIEPLFGPFAQRRCQSICAGRNSIKQQYCFSSCSRFALSEYGRRITLTPLSPEVEAREMIHTCDTKPLGQRKSLSKTEWNSSAQSQVKMFNLADNDKLSRDFGSTRLRFEKSSTLSNIFGNVEDSNASQKRFTESLIRTSCVRAHISLAELGISVAGENNDTYSKRFYQKMYKTLRTESLARERDLVRQAKSLGVFASE